MQTQTRKCEVFRALHHSGEAFIVPNPCDIGTAKLLQGLGFKALATTSVGFAYTHGLADGGVTLDVVLAFCTELAKSTAIPVAVDFENGFADTPAGVASNIARLAATGVAGGSIEDFDGATGKIYDFNQAVERVQAAVEAVRKLGMPFMLTARAENLFRNGGDVEDTIKRLQAYETAGADVLYAPAIRSLSQLRQVTAELRAPFNVLAPFIKGASVAELHTHGATRVSLGGALTWHAVSPVLRAAREMLTQGTFGWTDDMAAKQEVMKLIS
ncbi:MAG TPA: isocitrate lyase/phosphoenolpyruvate mutase family protein [Candidatus Acidoferrum sp.]|nr:isocitrate lyase/phosphoenolpyruvate mutase family protein [Candidatus Acidoferrum sp.]